ncbi:MAG: A24 family peptidase [Congregibacter sp.]
MTLGAFLSEHPLFFYTLLGLLGAVVGSFLNVVILRLPRIMRREWVSDCRALLELDAASEGQNAEQDEEPLSLAFPGSHCPSCGASIQAWQNIPVVSFLLLRANCAACKVRISPRYPLVETITAVASVCVGFYSGVSLDTVAYLFLTWTLIALSGIDIDTQLLPDDLTLPLLWAGLLFNLVWGAVSLQDAVIGAAAGYLLLWSIYWLFKLATGKEGMGYGDFKLLAALGAWLGWQGLPSIILLSSVVGAVLGILILALRKQDRSVGLPFGPYLAIAGWICLIWGASLNRLFLGGGI